MYRELNRPVCLLIVEDNPADVRILTFGLKEAGADYDLRVARNGNEALELLNCPGSWDQVSCPDLILLDLNLPGMNGHEVLHSVRANPELRAIPIVVLTSSRSRTDIQMAYEGGANSYLQKPDSLEETLDLMRTIQHYWLDLALLPADLRALA